MARPGAGRALDAQALGPLTQQTMAARMFPLTYDGLDEAMKMLRKGTLSLARY